MKFLKILLELYKLYKTVDATKAPKTVVIEASSKAAATAIADKISKDDPNVKIAVTAVTGAGVSILENVLSKKIKK